MTDQQWKRVKGERLLTTGSGSGSGGTVIVHLLIS